MKYFIIVALFLTAAPFLFATKEVSISEPALSFFLDINASQDYYHRSGARFIQKDKLPVMANISWSNGNNYNYKVVESREVIDKITTRLYKNGRLNKKEYMNKVFVEDSTLLIEKKRSPRPTDILDDDESLSKEDYVNIALSYLSGVDGMTGKFEIENIGFENASCFNCEDDFYNQERVSGIYVGFRRIFNGGIVRGNTSSIFIKLDPNGSLRKLKVRWPEFQKIDKEEIVETIENNLDEIIISLSNNDEAFVSYGQTSLGINNYEINSVAKAWILVKSADGMIISPAISYRLNVFLEDKSIIAKLVDMPLMPLKIK